MKGKIMAKSVVKKVQYVDLTIYTCTIKILQNTSTFGSNFDDAFDAIATLYFRENHKQ
jgi:hypothetical protein